MKAFLSTARSALLVIGSLLLMIALSQSAHASTAYGTLNNFDCVNDTGVEAHGFEIELDDVRSTDITYTYDYNHYGVPKITQDNTDPAHPKVFIRYAATRKPDGTWTAFTAIPSGPITPTDGHQFTNPSVNFGGEHFGAGYYGAPTAVKYNWLIDDGTGNLVHGPPVYVATPTFTYYPPVVGQPLPQVQAVIVPPPPPAPPVLQFGEATWVKDIKTTTHNPNKVELRDLVDPDPGNPGAKNWANNEPTEVETEWRILQTEFANAGNPKGELRGRAQDLPGGDEVVTRRYEFYKYTGPIDAETGEAMADTVAADGIHGSGSVTYADHFDVGTGEWVTVTVDLSTVVVVGEFFGAQMAGFDVVPVLGLIDHIPDGELNVPYPNAPWWFPERIPRFVRRRRDHFPSERRSASSRASFPERRLPWASSRSLSMPRICSLMLCLHQRNTPSRFQAVRLPRARLPRAHRRPPAAAPPETACMTTGHP